MTAFAEAEGVVHDEDDGDEEEDGKVEHRFGGAICQD